MKDQRFYCSMLMIEIEWTYSQHEIKNNKQVYLQISFGQEETESPSRINTPHLHTGIRERESNLKCGPNVRDF